MLEWLLRKCFRYSTAGPALTRYYLLPRMKLHRIHSSDKDFHSHPWNGISLILGYYWEYLEDEPLQPMRLRVLFNYVSATRRHKVHVTRPVWTLFIHGRKINPNWKYGESTKPWEGSDQERAKGPMSDAVNLGGQEVPDG